MDRKRIKILVEVDLDPVPGLFNKPEDWVKFIRRDLEDNTGHYNPTVKLLDE